FTLGTWITGLGAREAQLDLPGIAGAEQAGEITLALRPCGFELPGHELVVDGPLDVPEDADRRRAARRPRQAGQRERQAGLHVVRVVHQELRLVADVHDLDRPVRTLAHALRALLAEADGLPVLQIDPVRLVIAHEVERAV